MLLLVPRTIDPLQLAQFQTYSNVIRFGVFVQISFVSETMYVWTGYGNLSYGGNTYLGVGHLGSISSIQEDSTVQAQSVPLTLEGITEDDLSEALGDIRQGLPCKVWLAIFNANGTMLGAPTLSFAGRIDQPTISESVDTCTISIKCENRMADLQRSNERRYTQQQQQMLHPSDTGFNYVNQAAWYVSSRGQSN
jgi:hypothetical protein